MMEYIESLSLSEADNLKKIIGRLFRQTCILQMRYDPETLIPKDNPDYETCVRHKEFIEDYLSVLGCELIHDPQEHIFLLKGEGVELEKLSLTTTIILLIVRILYRDKILGAGLEATVTNLKEIRSYGRNTGLLNRKLTTAEWRDALYLMNRHQIIEVPGAVKDVEDETPIYLYSTINLYIRNSDIGELIEEYKEDAVNETIEESLYPDGD